MPRDGTGNYNQPFPNVASDTTIESVVYNGFTNDVALDLNAARPIIAGGTGATSADNALLNIGGEKASQVVTNYDSHVWQPGSFYSTASATGAPNSNAFAGICYLLNSSGDVGVEARDNTDGKLYLRAKTAGVWGAWAPDNAEMDAEKVNRSGDTMTGSLTITGGPYVGSLHLGNTATTKVRAIRIGVDAAAPLEFINAANNLATHTFGDNGDISAVGALSIGGSATISGRITASNEIMVSSGIIRFRNVESNYLFHTGTGYSLNGGPITVNGNIIGNDLHSYRSGAAHTGIIWLGDSGSRYLGWNGATYNLAGNVPFHIGGPIYAHTSVVGDFGVGSQIPSGLHSDGANVGVRAANASGAVYFTNYGASTNYGYASPLGLTSLRGYVQAYSLPGGNAHFQLLDEAATSKGYFYWERASNTININGAASTGIVLPPNGQVKVSNGIQSKDGLSGGYGTVCYNLAWQGGVGFHLYADDLHQGVIAYTSDYRTKKDVAELPRTWDIVKALRPIKYTQANYGPRARGDDGKEVTAGPQLYVADNIERWGFIAHELQETMIQSAASAEKDAPSAIQSPNPWTIIAALTRTIQEMQERIEALEDA